MPKPAPSNPRHSSLDIFSSLVIGHLFVIHHCALHFVFCNLCFALPMPVSHTVRVNLAERSYDVLIGHGVLQDLGMLAADLLGRKKCVIVTDANVGSPYAASAQGCLPKAGVASSV